MFFGGNSERKQFERAMRDAGRLPPGQSATLKWPVLHEGSVPRFDPQTWDFRIAGLVEQPVRLTWDEFTLKLAGAKPEAKYVMVAAEQGYKSNVPLEDLMLPATIFALKHNGEPLPAEHGYPVRLVVPNLYAWKSVKWVRGLEFMAHDAPGFWEENGYNMHGDPFKEQRFSS
jgi:DMSO/TMAO reductase YedYZ molybdopterin-dependent catalytic subunit